MGAGIQGASNQGAQQVSQTQQTANKEFIKELKNTQSEILNGFKELSDELGGRIKEDKQNSNNLNEISKIYKNLIKHQKEKKSLNQLLSQHKKN